MYMCVEGKLKIYRSIHAGLYAPSAVDKPSVRRQQETQKKAHQDEAEKDKAQKGNPYEARTPVKSRLQLRRLVRRRLLLWRTPSLVVSKIDFILA